jgi:hypothetical protein
MRAVEMLGVRACSYSSGSEWAITCDCKYGAESDRYESEPIYAGEQTGCPEMRSLYVLLRDMTDDELALISGRSMQILEAAFDEPEVVGAPCPYQLTELARQGGPPVRCRLDAGHEGAHQYGAPAECAHVCMREERGQ